MGYALTSEDSWVATLSQYEPLRRFLSDRRDRQWRATFAEAEKVLGFTLCASARKHRAWWANSNSHTEACAGWLAAGWETRDVDMGRERLVFLRQ